MENIYKFNSYPFNPISFSNYQKSIFNQNLDFYDRLKRHDSKALSTYNNHNKNFFKCLLDNNNVINLFINNDRGTHKSQLARCIALHIQKFSNQKVILNENSFCFSNFELYNKIKAHFQIYPVNLDLDKKNPITIFIRDEDTTKFGYDARTSIEKLKNLIDKIRIGNIILILISPNSTNWFESEIDYKYCIKPIAFNQDKWFCLTKMMGDDQFTNNIILKNYDKHNNKLFKLYNKLKINDFNNSTKELLDSQLNFVVKIFLLEKEFKIISNQKYKISKKKITIDFITLINFTTKCEILGFNETIDYFRRLHEYYKLTITNQKYLNIFKKYCKEKKYKLQITDNKSKLENNKNGLVFGAGINVI